MWPYGACLDAGDEVEAHLLWAIDNYIGLLEGMQLEPSILTHVNASAHGKMIAFLKNMQNYVRSVYYSSKATGGCFINFKGNP